MQNLGAIQVSNRDWWSMIMKYWSKMKQDCIIITDLRVLIRMNRVAFFSGRSIDAFEFDGATKGDATPDLDPEIDDTEPDSWLIPDEREDVQKKTFGKWINSQLSKVRGRSARLFAFQQHRSSSVLRFSLRFADQLPAGDRLVLRSARWYPSAGPAECPHRQKSRTCQLKNVFFFKLSVSTYSRVSVAHWKRRN